MQGETISAVRRIPLELSNMPIYCISLSYEFEFPYAEEKLEPGSAASWGTAAAT